MIPDTLRQLIDATNGQREAEWEGRRVLLINADWGELTDTIREVDPQETWITHGREEALLRWCQLHQRPARALALVGDEDEDD